METTTNLVDDAIEIVMSASETIAGERQAVSEQLHAAESYYDFIVSALEALASDLANNDGWEALCCVITEQSSSARRLRRWRRRAPSD
jgi:hypothetical protein